MTHNSDTGVNVPRKRHFINAPPQGDLPSGAPEKAFLQEFARRLQAKLVEKGWNQSDLAREGSRFMPKGKKLTRDNVSNYVRAAQFPQPVRLDAILKALRMTHKELVPAGAVKSVDEESPPVAMRALSDGNVWLQINQAVPQSLALEILSLMAKVNALKKDGQ